LYGCLLDDQPEQETFSQNDTNPQILESAMALDKDTWEIHEQFNAFRKGLWKVIQISTHHHFASCPNVPRQLESEIDELKNAKRSGGAFKQLFSRQDISEGVSILLPAKESIWEIVDKLTSLMTWWRVVGSESRALLERFKNHKIADKAELQELRAELQNMRSCLDLYLVEVRGELNFDVVHGYTT
jgi:hypothetical protein